MTHHEFNTILDSINALSPDQMRRLLRELETRLATDGRSSANAPIPEMGTDGQAIQRRLHEAGLLSEIKPMLRDMTPYRDRVPVPIQGEALSENVIRERR